MQAAIGLVGRFVSRTLFTGVVNPKENAGLRADPSQLVTAVSGVPKEMPSVHQSTESTSTGVIGEDAYFIASYVDHLLANMVVDSDYSSPGQPDLVDLHHLGRRRRRRRDSADLRASVAQPTRGQPNYSKTADLGQAVDVVGVADGVGGWREYGVDPSRFSSQLMVNCLRLVKDGHVDGSMARPEEILEQGYLELLNQRSSIVGSSTACLLMMDRLKRKVLAANIGDSGFVVVRDGKVIHRSREQQHCFNAPFQLAVVPSGMTALDAISDSPKLADRYEFSVRDGDFIIVATDGLFDNMPDSILLRELAHMADNRSTTPTSGRHSPTNALLSPANASVDGQSQNRGSGRTDYVEANIAKMSTGEAAPAQDAYEPPTVVTVKKPDDTDDLVGELQKRHELEQRRQQQQHQRPTIRLSAEDDLSEADCSAHKSSDVAHTFDEVQFRASLQSCAESIALTARKLSTDPEFLSPFAANAQTHNWDVSGGKPDDITVLLAAVRAWQPDTKTAKAAELLTAETGLHSAKSSSAASASSVLSALSL